MRPIAVYRSEREAGLEPLIRSAGSVAFAAPLEVSPGLELPEKTLARLRDSASASATDFDLYFLRSVLVTAGVWNRNDDVFDPAEVWLARATPEDKPFNFGHDCADIIGHMTGCVAVDDDGKNLPEDCVLDDLPPKFHLVSSAVLYRYWSKAELQERMDTLIAEIGRGKWKVSMEALFAGFDYAMTGPDGASRVVARNEQTAFLTKHLRAYGGKGLYEGSRVGRLLRSLVFSGKGLVGDPANPESSILKAAADFRPPVGYSTLTADFVGTSANVTEIPMAENASNPVEELKAEVARLQAALADKSVAQVTAAKEQAEAALKTATEDKQKLASELTVAKAAIAELSTRIEKAEAALAQHAAAEAKRARVEKVVADLKLEKAAAEEMVENLDSLSDEAFAGHVEALSKAYSSYEKSKTVEYPGTGSPSDRGVPAPKPGKETPAKLPPKSTPLPAPMSAEAATETEDDNADAANLEGAVPDKSAALAVSTPDKGVNEIKKAVASFFNCTPDEENE